MRRLVLAEAEFLGKERCFGKTLHQGHGTEAVRASATGSRRWGCREIASTAFSQKLPRILQAVRPHLLVTAHQAALGRDAPPARSAAARGKRLRWHSMSRADNSTCACQSPLKFVLRGIGSLEVVRDIRSSGMASASLRTLAAWGKASANFGLPHSAANACSTSSRGPPSGSVAVRIVEETFEFAPPTACPNRQRSAEACDSARRARRLRASSNRACAAVSHWPANSRAALSLGAPRHDRQKAVRQTGGTPHPASSEASGHPICGQSPSAAATRGPAAECRARKDKRRPRDPTAPRSATSPGRSTRKGSCCPTTGRGPIAPLRRTTAPAPGRTTETRPRAGPTGRLQAGRRVQVMPDGVVGYPRVGGQQGRPRPVRGQPLGQQPPNGQETVAGRIQTRDDLGDGPLHRVFVGLAHGQARSLARKGMEDGQAAVARFHGTGPVFAGRGRRHAAPRWMPTGPTACPAYRQRPSRPTAADA